MAEIKRPDLKITVKLQSMTGKLAMKTAGATIKDGNGTIVGSIDAGIDSASLYIDFEPFSDGHRYKLTTKELWNAVCEAIDKSNLKLT